MLFVLQAGIYDEAMSSFFRNVDTRYGDPSNIPVGDACGKIRSLKARVCFVFLKFNCLCMYCLVLTYSAAL